MTGVEGDTSNKLPGEGLGPVLQQEAKASIDDDVAARIKRESARVEPEEAAESAGMAHELKQKSVPETVEIEPESGRDRARARRGKLC
jgi:hypothetical protein